MKYLKDEIQNRWKDHRQNSSGTWSGMIIKIALLVLVVWLISNMQPGKGYFLKNFLKSNQVTQPSKGTK